MSLERRLMDRGNPTNVVYRITKTPQDVTEFVAGVTDGRHEGAEMLLIAIDLDTNPVGKLTNGGYILATTPSPVTLSEWDEINKLMRARNEELEIRVTRRKGK